MLDRIIQFFIHNRLVSYLLLLVFVGWGIVSSPFGWDTGILPSDPVPVDAIPDIGENQQIVYTQWKGRSPQDIEDQISYPLTTALLGIPGVNTIRSNSIFGMSSIYIIFDEDIEFYWSRTRILEKLNSLPAGTLPDEVTPALGPDATALGQVFWYTLEGRDKQGRPAGGWDLQELRSIQDFYVRYSLSSARGVAEVASIGGFVKEYQVDIDPNAMKANGVSVTQIMQAVKKSNLDIGARTIEFNRAEYLIRALGYIKNIGDLENSVVAVRNNTPIRIKDVARVQLGPATRRGGLDKDGAEAVGGVVVARYGANPLEVIDNVKAQIAEVSAGLPSKILDDGTVSKVTIVPFYDRSGLIHETLGTLEEALTLEILISIIVVIILVFNLRASLLISSLLPIGVLMTFIIMRRTGVDANIVALSGIAIAIGVMVDVGVVFTENIIQHIEKWKGKSKQLKEIIFEATSEVAPAVITALTTTIISFLPVFAMEAAEGKLFKPLAFTKTFAMLSALFIGIIIIPTLAHFIFSLRLRKAGLQKLSNFALIVLAIPLLFFGKFLFAFAITAIAANNLLEHRWPERFAKYPQYITIGIIAFATVRLLAQAWLPLGAQQSSTVNTLFTALLIGFILFAMHAVVVLYPRILGWALRNKWKFLSIPGIVVIFGLLVWQGVHPFEQFMPENATKSSTWKQLTNSFPGIGKEFMPPLDEGSFLLMPTTMPHAGIEENIDVIRMLDKKVSTIPEVDEVVGKWGRVQSALDPAPVSMFENIINYKPEFILDENGSRIRFLTHDTVFILDAEKLSHINTELGDKDSVRWYFNNRTHTLLIGENDGWTDAKNRLPKQRYQQIVKDIGQYLIPDEAGKYFRQWRPEIQSPDDIWDEIVRQAEIPGLTSAPKLQPIQTRLVMLQTGMRAPMGIKVFGPDLETIEQFGYKLESLLKNTEGVAPQSVFADRVVGKPYLQIEINRSAISRYGLSISDMQMALSSAVGGMQLSTTVEGRERYPVRVRYAREFRDNPEDLAQLLVPTPTGVQVPLGELASISYARGPQLIKSENTFLVGYVIFDKLPGYAEVDVVEHAQKYLNDAIAEGTLEVPPGINYRFTGNYENQLRATKRLMIVIPISLLAIFLILYFQFRSVTAASLIFTGIFVAFSGGFIMLWLYGQSWFLNFSIAGTNLQDMLQIGTVNLSVAVWVGFIALFGIATDDGVLISTYLKQIFERKPAKTVAEIRANVLEAGSKRVRPAMMTTATTIIALLPVLSSTGKGSDIMVPMAIPTFGGMIIAVLSIFVVPVLYSMWKERSMIKGNK